MNLDVFSARRAGESSEEDGDDHGVQKNGGTLSRTRQEVRRAERGERGEQGGSKSEREEGRESESHKAKPPVLHAPPC